MPINTWVLNQQFSSGSDSAPFPEGDIWQCQGADTGCYNSKKGTGIQWVETRNAMNSHNAQDSSPQQRIIWLKMSIVPPEKLQAKYMSLGIHY